MNDERLEMSEVADDGDIIHPLPPSGYSRLSQGESRLRKHCASNCLSPPILGIINDEDYSINWFHMIKQDLSLLPVHFFTRWPLAAAHDGLRMKTWCGWMVTTASCFILFESVDELINIRWKILSHTKSTELTDFPILWRCRWNYYALRA